MTVLYARTAGTRRLFVRQLQPSQGAMEAEIHRCPSTAKCESSAARTTWRRWNPRAGPSDCLPIRGCRCGPVRHGRPGGHGDGQLGYSRAWPLMATAARVRKVPAIERGHVAAVPVQPLAAGQAPWPAYRLIARAADPEPGRVLPAVDAQLDRVRQQAGRGHGAPGRRDCGSGPAPASGGPAPVSWPAELMADCHVRGGRDILDEPSGKAIAA
jgi:hypothetical protein